MSNDSELEVPTRRGIGALLLASITPIANLAVIATVAVMWLIYTGERDQQQDMMRKQVSLTILQIGYDQTIVAAEQAVSAFFVEHEEDYLLAYQANLIGDAKPSVSLDSDTQRQFITLIDYYDDVLTCRESSRCDADMLDEWFQEDICNFTEFAGLIGFEQLRATYGSPLGARLDAYLAESCQG